MKNPLMELILQKKTEDDFYEYGIPNIYPNKFPDFYYKMKFEFNKEEIKKMIQWIKYNNTFYSDQHPIIELRCEVNRWKKFGNLNFVCIHKGENTLEIHYNQGFFKKLEKIYYS